MHKSPVHNHQYIVRENTKSTKIIDTKYISKHLTKEGNREYTFKAGASPQIILQNTQPLSPFSISLSPLSPQAQTEARGELNDVVAEVSAGGFTWEESRAKRRRARASIGAVSERKREREREWGYGLRESSAMDFKWSSRELSRNF